MTSILWRVEQKADGTYALSAPIQAEKLNDASPDILPEGAYTTLRTYGGTGLIVLDDHFNRLEETADLLGYPIELNRSQLRRLLCQILRHQPSNESLESRVRLTVDCTRTPGEVWISTDPLTLPHPMKYVEGVSVLTRSMYRENPKAKDSAFIAASADARQLISSQINEVLMIGLDGGVLEGLSSNFFGIRDGFVMTADEGVLYGLTRSLILDELKKAGLPIKLESIPAESLSTLDEAFISSTSRAVLPVVEIDGQPVGDGKPGALTQRIGQLYKARLEQEIKDVCEGAISISRCAIVRAAFGRASTRAACLASS